jgi:pyruvate dehydrogenase E2 component (dihydrolipoamide acetyltransferase)
MAIEMIMPKVDMDQETGTVVEWLKTNGDRVQEGETILVIETDKIAIDVEAPGTGILNGISAHPGDVIPIGTVIAYILEEGEEAPVPASKPEIKADQKPAPEQAPSREEIQATPVARKMAEAHGLDLGALTPSGKGGKVTKEDVEAALQPTGRDLRQGKIIAAPAARRTARIKGIDLGQVPGSGPGGRIQAFDVEKYQALPAAPAPSPVLQGDTIPLVGMRRTIAERLTASYQSIPHIQFTARVDMTNFDQARSDYNQLAREKGDEKVSVTALLVKLVAMVLVDHPMINSSLLDDLIHLHQDINLGVAVALDKGLIVPVIKNANLKGIREISAEAADLVNRARNGTLTSADVKGGTFTISNLGPFGVEQFNAIINPPEAGILAIGATTSEVVALDNNAIAVRPIMRFTLSADHRIVDGAIAANFIADLKSKLENPILMNY